MIIRPAIALLLLSFSCTAAAPGGDDGDDGAGDGDSGGEDAPGTGGGDGDDGDGDGGDDPAGCVDDGDPFSVAMIQQHLVYLASEELDGRAPGTAGDLAARAYLAARFECLGLAPGGVDGTWFQPIVDSNGDDSANVVAVIRGADPLVGDEIVALGAHMDHFGDGYLGANDNASGTVAVLSAAQAIAQGEPPRRTMAFILWASEEVNFDGSVHFVENPTELPGLHLDDFVYYVNFDMVGSYTAYGNSVDACGTIGDTPARGVLEDLLVTQPGLNVTTEIEGYGSDDSDYYPFCINGVPFVGFEQDDPCWHETCDTADRIDYPNMARIVELATAMSRELADTVIDLAAYRAGAAVADLGCGD